VSRNANAAGRRLGRASAATPPTSRGEWIFILAASLITAVITFGLADRHMSWPWVLVLCVSIAAAALLIGRTLRRP
jgi:hypothetical protein